MAKKYERLLDKATDSTLLDPNWDAIIDCVDAIRSGEIQSKQALQAIRKRAHNENPHVAHHALMVLEACVKNCGHKVHGEVATKEFMEDIKHLAMDCNAEKVKEKILALVQCWSEAFADKTEYKIVVDTHNLMQLEGFEFPAVQESEAMFAAESAPDWAQGDNCFRCRAQFGLLTRKHHCRACGQIFCDKCSSRQVILPKYGIEKAVRVCESCFEKPSAKKTKDKDEAKIESGAEEGKEKQLKEEEELALAVAISQSEADEKERQRRVQLYQLYNGPEDSLSSTTDSAIAVYKGADDHSHSDIESCQEKREEVDPELARYLDRGYWEKRRLDQKSNGRRSATPSAPPSNDTMAAATEINQSSSPFATLDIAYNSISSLPADDTQLFTSDLNKQVQIFENRIRSNQARGRSILNDSSIQSLFIKLTDMHSAVLARMQQLDDTRAHFESLQDHLSNIEEARQAINALRTEHERKKRDIILEEQRKRQLQMQGMLTVMRQKKHDMLIEQRQMALQRFQQQQIDMEQRRKQQTGGGPVHHSAHYMTAMSGQQQIYMDGNSRQTVPSSLQQEAFLSSYCQPQYIQQQHVSYNDPNAHGQGSYVNEMQNVIAPQFQQMTAPFVHRQEPCLQQQTIIPPVQGAYHETTVVSGNIAGQAPPSQFQHSEDHSLKQDDNVGELISFD